MAKAGSEGRRRGHEATPGGAELFVFARFHARPGAEDAVAAALLAVVPPSRREPGCLGIDAYRSTRDPRLHIVHSRWVDEAAFERHAGLPHTVRFVARVEPLLDHALDVVRTRRIGGAPAEAPDRP